MKSPGASPDLEYEEFNEIREQPAAIIEEQLAIYKTRQTPLDSGLVVRESIRRNTRARVISLRRGAYCYRSSGTSWRSASRFHRTASQNGQPTRHGFKGTGACH